jgi:hypothetical protein
MDQNPLALICTLNILEYPQIRPNEGQKQSSLENP